MTRGRLELGTSLGSKPFLFRGRLEMFPGRSVVGSPWDVPGQYTVQVETQTAPCGVLLKTE